MEKFLNKYWCNSNMGICYPLLKEVDITKPITDQKNYNNEYGRYWIKPALQINGKHYILCSQWFREFQEKFDKWVNENEQISVNLPKTVQSVNTSESSKIYENNPSDFRFSKDTYVKEAIPEYNNLNQKMGTPSHIEYLKMSEDDNRRHRARCIEYDNKKSVCMCVKSPYFTMRCGGASHCKYYTEHESFHRTTNDSISQEKPKIYVVSADIQKKRKCTKCQCNTVREMITVTYNNNGTITTNKLGVYVCQRCGRKHLIDNLYRTYSNTKNMDKVNFEFVKRYC